MSVFFDRFSLLCSKQGETPNSFAKKNGIPSGSVTAWKRGSMPRPATLDKIAAYFGVTVDYLLGKDPEENAGEVTFDDFTYAMYEESKGLSEEERQKLLELARFFNEQRKKKQ